MPAHGGVDMNPTGKKVKKKDDAEDVLRRTILKKMGAMSKKILIITMLF